MLIHLLRGLVAAKGYRAEVTGIIHFENATLNQKQYDKLRAKISAW